MCHHKTGDNLSSEYYLVVCGLIQWMEIIGEPMMNHHFMGFGGDILYEQLAPTSPSSLISSF